MYFLRFIENILNESNFYAIQNKTQLKVLSKSSKSGFFRLFVMKSTKNKYFIEIEIILKLFFNRLSKIFTKEMFIRF